MHSIYVVDEKNRLKGRLSLKDLITANSKDKVKDIYIPKVDYVTVEQEKEEIAKIRQRWQSEKYTVVGSETGLQCGNYSLEIS